MNPPSDPATLFVFPAPGQWPWDHWQRLALERGLAPDLAALGRSLMREADQHGWCSRLQSECGLHDAGRAMLARLLAHPRRTTARLTWLYATDGLRFDPWERNEFYPDSPHWKAMRLKWNREQAALALSINSQLPTIN